MHETCGLGQSRIVAAVAEAAGLNICIPWRIRNGHNDQRHKSGCRHYQQYGRWQIDNVASVGGGHPFKPEPGAPRRRLPIGVLPGLGLEPNRGAVSRAAESYRQLEK